MSEYARRAEETERALNALRSQIESIRDAQANAPKQESAAVQKLRAENAELKAKVAQAKKDLDAAEAICMPDTAALLDKAWTVKSEIYQKDFNGRNPAVAKVDEIPAGAVIQNSNQKESKKNEASGSNSNNANKGNSGGEKKEKKAKKPKQPQPVAPDVPALSRLDMRVGRIVEVEYHPDADSLYVEKVDIGDAEPRTILSGLVKHVPIEEMRGRLAIFFVNLKPSKMRGIVSEGMIMCANDDGKVEILDLPEGCEPGDHVVFEGFERTPDKQLNPKKKVWEGIMPDMRTDKDCIARYKDVAFKVKGRDGNVRAKSMASAQIR